MQSDLTLEWISLLTLKKSCLFRFFCALDSLSTTVFSIPSIFGAVNHCIQYPKYIWCCQPNTSVSDLMKQCINMQFSLLQIKFPPVDSVPSVGPQPYNEESVWRVIEGFSLTIGLTLIIIIFFQQKLMTAVFCHGNLLLSLKISYMKFCAVILARSRAL